MDIGGWLPRLMGKKRWHFMAMHLFYFSRDTCTSLLEKSGFNFISKYYICNSELIMRFERAE